jgi:acetyltransferase-like isoleucine patch superfamily enzyme
MTESAAALSDAPQARRQLTPALVTNRVLSLLRARWYLRGATFCGRVYSMGRLLVSGARNMRVGPRVFFLRGMLRTELRCAGAGRLEIGESCGFNYGVSLVASELIRIGERCNFGSMVRVRDDDGLRCAPVLIGNDVWIAHGAIVEPGVTIGDGAVISAGAVVTSDVPARMLAAGNPARCIPLRRRAGAPDGGEGPKTAA